MTEQTIVGTIIAPHTELVLLAVATTEHLCDKYVFLYTSQEGYEENLQRCRSLTTRPIEGVHWPWRDHFGDARQAAYEAAIAAGADWVLTVDDDERFVMNDALKVRQFLATEAAGQACVLAFSRAKHYRKYRILSGKQKGWWIGSTHEYYNCESWVTIPYELLHFTEENKTTERVVHKWARDALYLEQEVASIEQKLAAGQDPKVDVSHRYYYLAESYFNAANAYTDDQKQEYADKFAVFATEGLQKYMYRQAKRRYRQCAEHSPHGHERADALLRAALCELACTSDMAEVIEIAKESFTAEPIAESAWLVAYGNYQQRDYVQSEIWARLSVLLSPTAEALFDFLPPIDRNGFVHPLARERPFDILYWASHKMGRGPEHMTKISKIFNEAKDICKKI